MSSSQQGSSAPYSYASSSSQGREGNGENGGNGSRGGAPPAGSSSHPVYYNYSSSSSASAAYYGHSSRAAATGEARPHVIVERTNTTPIDSLRQFIVEMSRDGVTSYFCGWQGCQHPVGFAKQSQLVGHVRSVHLQEKPFVCTTCNANFDRRQDASRHVATLNRRQYKCSGCGRSFSRKDDRDAHEEECLTKEE